MRDFKNPYYDGPECACCKAIATKEHERIIKVLKELLNEKSGINLQGAISILERETK